LSFNQTGGVLPTNARNAQIVTRSGNPVFELLDDSFLNATQYMAVIRNGVMPLNVSFPNGIISSTQNKVLNDTSYKTNAFQSYVSPANATLGVRPGFSFNSENNFGAYFYMNGFGDYKVRESNGSTFSFMLNPMTTTSDLIYGGTNGIPTKLGIGSNGQVLTVTGGVPTWSSATGSTNPMTTQNDIIYGGAGGAPTRLGIGSPGQVLTSNGSSTAPSWQTPTVGGITAGRLQSFYTAVMPGTSVGDIYSYTVPANTMVNNGAVLDVTFEGIMTSGGTYQYEVFFADNSIFSQPSGATSGGVLPGDKISIHFKIYRTGTSTAYAIGSIFTGVGTSISLKDISINLTGLDFTTSNIIKIAGATTVGAFKMRSGDVLFYQ
jgi:hypothetical protein